MAKGGGRGGKRGVGGRKSGKSGGKPTGGKRRTGRAGRRERAGESPNRVAAKGRAGRGKRPERRDGEGRVVEVAPPTSRGQWLSVEDGEGVVWRVECLGEPVSVGARILFVPIGEGRESPPTGELARVLDAERETWVARFVRSKGSQECTLIPFAGAEVPELFLSGRDAKGAEHGDRVLVAPLGGSGLRSGGSSRTRRHRGGAQQRRGLPVRVVEVFGPAGDPTPDHKALVWKHRLPTAFSRRTRLEAEEIDAAVGAAERARRTDLRHLPFITIDPASAKDHDDAVFAEERPASPDLFAVSDDGDALGAGTSREPKPTWHRRLWVAIADVSHFVLEDGFLDSEARRRGNSFYFPDRSIPMLPERLSSDLCSLRPDVDRLAMVVELRIGAEGTVVDALFHEALIRSHARLAYEDAAAWLEKAQSKDERYPKEMPIWGASLLCLDSIAIALTRAREEAGALTLELPEIGIVVDEAGVPQDAQVRTRNRAHILIEEAMLAANRAVAKALDLADRPTLHRSHPPPAPQKLQDLTMLLERHGVAVKGSLETPGVLARALGTVRGLASQERLHLAALRSMSQARYQVKSEGHYALRFDHYLHFTSPIRRYADLEVHRVLRRLIRGEAEARDPKGENAERAERVAAWLSGRERVAQEAERDANALAACSLMRGRESARFEAAVTGVSDFGVFVRLASPAPAVEGLVPVRTMRGRWDLDPEGEALVQQGSQARLAIGDALRVQLTEVDPDRARLTFAMLGPKRPTPARDKRR